MATANKPGCEVRIDGVWRPMSLGEAHAEHGSAPKRCPACHGRVSITGNYTAQRRFMLAHRKGHDGCPLMPARFDGTPRPHPEAVE